VVDQEPRHARADGTHADQGDFGDLAFHAPKLNGGNRLQLREREGSPRNDCLTYLMGS
jgi:hypothetical protein